MQKQYLRQVFGINLRVYSIGESMEKTQQNRSMSYRMEQLKESIMHKSVPSESMSSHQLLNGSASHRLFERVVLFDQTLAVLLVIQLVLFHCYVVSGFIKYELDIAGNFYAQWFLRGGQVCAAIGICVLIVRHVQPWSRRERLKAMKNDISSLPIKIVMFLIIPYEFTDSIMLDLSYADTASEVNVDYTEKLNYFLIILACFRLAYFGASVLIRSRYMSPRSGRICKLYGAYPGMMFCLKSIFKDDPFTFVAGIFFVSVTIFTFGFRIAENTVMTTSPITSYSNMAWMTIITMTTVGYGDFSPKTQIGRLIGALCVSWGVLIVSVMVVVLTQAFAMNRNESQTLNILKKLQTHSELRRVAGQFLRESVWRLWRNHKLRLRSRQQMKERKLMLKFRHFRRLRDMASISESQIDFYNQMTRQFERAFINLENLTSNNLMIINYLNEEYIFKGKEAKEQANDNKIVKTFDN